MSTTLSLVSELERIAHALEAEGAETQLSLPAITEKIARIMGVRQEEVAILAFRRNGNTCIFSCPRR